MMINTYKDLKVWQKAVDLSITIYKITSNFPKEEIYGLTSQIRRATVSIPSNIAEGHGRNSTKDYIRFLNIAYGSICELDTQLLIAQKLGYLTDDNVFEQVSEVERMTKALLVSLKAKSKTSPYEKKH